MGHHRAPPARWKAVALQVLAWSCLGLAVVLAAVIVAVLGAVILAP